MWAPRHMGLRNMWLFLHGLIRGHDLIFAGCHAVAESATLGYSEFGRLKDGMGVLHGSRFYCAPVWLDSTGGSARSQVYAHIGPVHAPRQGIQDHPDQVAQIASLHAFVLG